MYTDFGCHYSFQWIKYEKNNNSNYQLLNGVYIFGDTYMAFTNPHVSHQGGMHKLLYQVLQNVLRTQDPLGPWEAMKISWMA